MQRIPLGINAFLILFFLSPGCNHGPPPPPAYDLAPPADLTDWSARCAEIELLFKNTRWWCDTIVGTRSCEPEITYFEFGRTCSISCPTVIKPFQKVEIITDALGKPIRLIFPISTGGMVICEIQGTDGGA